jgi:hypothetical protein
VASERRKSFLLRVDPALWAELERWAQDELRSVNGQIEYLLRQAVLKRRGIAAPPGPVESVPVTAPDATAAPGGSSASTGQAPPAFSQSEGLELDRQD